MTDGVLNILKPPGMTSHDVVSFIRRTTGIKKVGHTGTLDPNASGVLPICLGKATKISEYLLSEEKEYIFEVKFGNKTDTCDRYGKFLLDKDLKANIDIENLNGILNKFKGEIMQTPPSYSAIKINGQRAYSLARQGISVDIKPRKVKIYSLKLLDFKPPLCLFYLKCSKGTYVRSLCRDIGEEIGTYGYMNFLLRKSTGSFDIGDSCTLDDIKDGDISKYIIEMDKALSFSPVKLSRDYEKRILNGNSVKVDNIENGGPYSVYLEDKFVGIGKVNDDILYIEKLLV